MQKSELFRREAAEALSSHQVGPIILASEKIHSTVAVLAMLVFVGILIFMVLGKYTRRTELVGQLTPTHGTVKVYTQQPGRITAQLVEEGQVVKAGDLLFRVSTDRITARGDALEGIGRQVEERLTRLHDERARSSEILQKEMRALNDRVVGLVRETKQIRTQIRVAMERANVAKELAGSYQSLVAQDLVTNEQYQIKRAEYLDQQARVNALNRELIGVIREITARRSEAASAELKLRNDASQLDRQIALTREDQIEAEARGKLEIRSPVSGMVTTITAYLGQSTDSTKPIAAVVPSNEPLVAELFAPSSAIGFVVPGQEVLIRLQAFPYQKFGHVSGTVASVSRTSLPPNELPGALIAEPRDGRPVEPVYRVTISLQEQTVRAFGKDVSLQAGMTIKASIYQETRRIYEWALEPLFTVSGKL